MTHNSETYDSCMEWEAAENRVRNKLAELREEIEEGYAEIRQTLNTVKNAGNFVVSK